MIRIYGSPHCPDCVACKAAFDEKGTPYEFIDITGSMPNLKAFLKMRHHLPLFEEVKERGSVGIPAIEKEDGTITLDWEEVLKEYGMTAQPGKACGLDGKDLNCESSFFHGADQVQKKQSFLCLNVMAWNQRASSDSIFSASSGWRL